MDKLLSGRRILVVEDEMLNLWTIEGMLADLGCQSVTSAATIPQALRLIEDQDFDAGMLDINLNDVQSYPIADALAARGIPFLFSTGYSDDSLPDDYRGRPVLKKPMEVEALLEIFERLCPRTSGPKSKIVERGSR
jgi:CheY-like chemotaxis protein